MVAAAAAAWSQRVLSRRCKQALNGPAAPLSEQPIELMGSGLKTRPRFAYRTVERSGVARRRGKRSLLGHESPGPETPPHAKALEEDSSVFERPYGCENGATRRSCGAERKTTTLATHSATQRFPRCVLGPQPVFSKRWNIRVCAARRSYTGAHAVAVDHCDAHAAAAR